MPRRPLSLPTDYQLRLASAALLGVLVCVHLLIYAKMPVRAPSWGEYLAEFEGEDEASIELMLDRLPVGWVHGGTVNVDNTVDVQGSVMVEGHVTADIY